jgi:16S rRNA (guanine1516-N2)-methyltransferase
MRDFTKPETRLEIDLTDPALLYRLRTSGKRQGIGKAIGLDMTPAQVHVLDCTAGLGRDALVLAHLGCRLTLLERSPIVHAALQAAMAQAAGHPLLTSALPRMTLHHANALDWFARIEKREVPAPDVIYLDPMFPERSKSAKVKKGMAQLQALLGPDEDLPEVLAAALRVAHYRVVVKRPPGNHLLPGPAPAFTLGGKASHFSVYTNKSLSSMPL